jgi:hypothetical protein
MRREMRPFWVSGGHRLHRLYRLPLVLVMEAVGTRSVGSRLFANQGLGRRLPVIYRCVEDI